VTQRPDTANRWADADMDNKDLGTGAGDRDAAVCASVIADQRATRPQVHKR
jgi:hypothetical protein